MPPRRRKAERVQLRLRMVLKGPDHSGKSLSALYFAYALGGTVCVIDTDYGNAEKYVGLPNVPEFDVIPLEAYTPEDYLEAIQEARGADVLIVDTISKEWIASLGIVDELTLASESKNAFTIGWNKVTPRHNKMVEALRTFPGHVIVTVRERMKYVLKKNDRGKIEPEKLGLSPIQREDFPYGWDIIGTFDRHNTMTVEARKGVGLDIQGLVVRKPGPEFMEPINVWLGAGQRDYTLHQILAAAEAVGHGPADIKAQMLVIAPGVASGNQLNARQREELYVYFTSLATPAPEPVSDDPQIQELDQWLEADLQAQEAQP